MPVIDERGRLFGRVNLIDAAIALVVLLCVPLGYGAYQLFRVPAPQIISVVPASLVQASGDEQSEDLRVRLEGQHFKMFYRVVVGGFEARLLVESPISAEVLIPAQIQPGTYDLILYDVAQEIARRPNAIVIEPPPPPPPPATLQLEVLGAFVGLGSADAEALGRVEKLGERGEVGAAEVLFQEPPKHESAHLSAMPVVGSSDESKLRINALLRLGCALVGGDCQVGETAVVPGAVISLERETGSVQFQVVDSFPESAASTVEVSVRGAFVGLDRVQADHLVDSDPAGERSPGSWGRVVSLLAPPEPETIQLRGSAGPVGGATSRFKVPALTVVRCSVTGSDCKVGSATLAPNAVFPIVTSAGVLSFEVAELYPAPPRSAAAELEVIGAFVGLSAATAKALEKLQVLGREGRIGSAEILFIEREQEVVLPGVPGPRRNEDESLRLNALLRVPCAMLGEDCRVGGTVLAPGIVLPLEFQNELLQFQISDAFPLPAGATIEVSVRGFFVGLENSRAKRLAGLNLSGMSTHGSWSRLLSLTPAEPEIVLVEGTAGPVSGMTGKVTIEALAAVRCAVVEKECRVGGVALAPGSTFLIPTLVGILRFQVAELFPVGTTLVDVTVRCGADPKILALVQDDLRGTEASPSALLALRPRLVDVGSIQEDAVVDTILGAYRWAEGGSIFSVVIRVPAHKTALGWQHGAVPLRAGAQFTYEQPSYTLLGIITGVRVAPEQGDGSGL